MSDAEALERTYIEIPLKSRKRVVSLRVDESALLTIDRYVASRGIGSRTLLISRIVEGLAKGLEGVGEGLVEEIQLTLLYRNGSGRSSVGVAIKLRD